MMGHSFGDDITNGVYGHRTVEELRSEIEKIISFKEPNAEIPGHAGKAEHPDKGHHETGNEYTLSDSAI